MIIDSGCSDASGNSAKLNIRDHELYTGWGLRGFLLEFSATKEFLWVKTFLGTFLGMMITLL